MEEYVQQPHPMRRAEDIRDPRVDVVLNELSHIRASVERVEEKVTVQNGRVGKLEQAALVDRTREEVIAEMIKERSDHTLRVMALVVTLVGTLVTAAVKLL